MKLILLEKVANLGELGETVEVKSGYGRNFLVPQGIALPATKSNVEVFEERRVELEAAANEKLATARTRAEALSAVILKLDANASDEGKLFGSIGPREIADAVTATGVELEKAEVIMGEGPIRNTGAYDIPIQLHADVVAEIKVIVNEEDIVALAKMKKAEADVQEIKDELDYDTDEVEVVEAVLEDEGLEGEAPDQQGTVG